MDFKWSDELESMRKMAYDFAVKNVKPTMEEDEKEHKYRPELLKKMGSRECSPAWRLSSSAGSASKRAIWLRPLWRLSSPGSARPGGFPSTFR